MPRYKYELLKLRMKWKNLLYKVGIDYFSSNICNNIFIIDWGIKYYMSNLLLFFLQGIPEMVGIVALSLALAKVPLRWKFILILGVLLAIFVYFIRTINFSFGIHTIASMLLMVIIIIKLVEVKPSVCLICGFTSYMFLAILELVIHEPFFALTKLDPSTVMSNEVLWAILGITQAIILNMIAILVSKVRKPVKDVWKI